MSIFLPILALLVASAFAAYHRLRLAVWAALAACLLVACHLLGANHTTVIALAALTAAVAVLLLIPVIR